MKPQRRWFSSAPDNNKEEEEDALNTEQVEEVDVVAGGAVDARRQAAVQHTRGSRSRAEAAANMSGRPEMVIISVRDDTRSRLLLCT